MRLLSEDDINRLLEPNTAIDAVARAAIETETGTAIVPARSHVEWPGGVFLAMPARSLSSFGAKLVSVIRNNARLGLPVTNGVMIVNEGTTGVPRALLNGAALTARRTGAVGALGLMQITPSGLQSVGIVGCGVQALWQALYAATVRPISEIYCFGRSIDALERFKSDLELRLPSTKIVACADIRDLLDRAQAIIAATSSASPVLPDEPDLLCGKHFVSIGSFRPTMQELPDSVYRLAGEVLIDSDAARHEVGDIIGPVARGVITPHNVFTLGKSVAGQRRVRSEGTTVFKSVGMASYDLFVAEALVKEAEARGVGTVLRL